MKQQWAQPTKVDDVNLVFGGNMIQLLPSMVEIPSEFKDWNGGNKWVKFQETWFFEGLDFTKLTPKDGVDANDAIRHLAAIQRSYEPKHEHKTAGVAYLASLWFDDYHV